jgi:hypothetical protein
MTTKPASEFARGVAAGEYKGPCRECARAGSRTWRAANREHNAAYHRDYAFGGERPPHLDERRKLRAEGRCIRCKGPKLKAGPGWCDACRKAYDTPRRRETRHRLKLEVIAAYGGACACCGESTPEFLAVDHVDDDGAAHRRELGKHRSAGAATYEWLKRNGFPRDRFQLLCHNCNFAKSTGGCPHGFV